MDLPQREFAQTLQHTVTGLTCDRSAANLVTMTAFGLSSPGVLESLRLSMNKQHKCCIPKLFFYFS